MAVTADVVVTRLVAETSQHDAKIRASAAQFEQRMAQMSRAAERAGKATSLVGINPAFDKFASGAETSSRAVAGLGNSVQRTNLQVGNLAAQFNDIGVQLAGGQSPFLIALQQGTQINQVIGQSGVRGAVGALGAAFASMVNPVSLATIGIIAFGGAAVNALVGLLSSSEDTTQSLEDMNKVIQAAADQWGEAAPALKAYADELQRVADLSQLVEGTNAAITQTFQQLQTDFEGVRNAASNAGAEMQRLGASPDEINVLRDAMNELQRAIVDTETALKDGSDATEEFERFNAALASLLSNDLVQGSNDFVRALQGIGDAYEQNIEQARRFAQEAARANAQAAARPGTGGRLPNLTEALRSEIVFEGGRFDGEEPETEPRRRRGGGGRNSAARQAEREREAVTDLIAALEHEQSLIGLTAVEKEKLNNLRKAGAAATPEERARIEELTQAIYDENAAIEAQERAYKQLQQIGEQAVNGIVNAFADGKIEAEEMIQIVGRLIQQLLTVQNIGGAGGGGGLFGFLGSLFGGGGGGSVGGFTGALGLFSKGGVTNKPAIFGEAGPEAAVPLPDGRSIPVNLRMPVGMGAAGSSGPTTINVKVDGANGDQHVIDLVNQGVTEALTVYPASKQFQTGVQNSVRQGQKTLAFRR